LHVLIIFHYFHSFVDANFLVYLECTVNRILLMVEMTWEKKGHMLNTLNVWQIIIVDCIVISILINYETTFYFLILRFKLQVLNPRGDGSLASFWDLIIGPGFKPSEVQLLSALCLLKWAWLGGGNGLQGWVCCCASKEKYNFIWHPLSPWTSIGIIESNLYYIL